MKNFKEFINEELSPDTYKKVANKLKEKGHTSRSNKILRHIKDQIKNMKPVTFQMYGEEFTITDKNVILIDDGNLNDLEFGINFDLGVSTENDDIEEQSGAPVIFFHFQLNKKTNEYDFYTDGLLIPDRKNAYKLLKFIKEYFSYHGGLIENQVNKLTVNDLYHE